MIEKKFTVTDRPTLKICLSLIEKKTLMNLLVLNAILYNHISELLIDFTFFK